MRLANILHLGVKELRSLARDPIMLVLIVYAFTVSIYTAATAMPETLNKAPIAIVDEDRSPLSARIVDAFYPPLFPAAGADHAGRDGRPHGRRPRHLRARHPAGFPARRAGRHGRRRSSSTSTPRA